MVMAHDHDNAMVMAHDHDYAMVTAHDNNYAMPWQSLSNGDDDSEDKGNGGKLPGKEVLQGGQGSNIRMAK